MRQNGLTLTELLFTLLIVALLLTIGLPSFSSQIQSTQTRTATLQLLESINLTRTLAVSKGQRATLRHMGDWTEGWQVFVDTNDNGLLDEDEHLVSQMPPTKGVYIQANQPLREYVSFIQTGESRYVGRANAGAFQAGTVNICPKGYGTGYKLVLARSGRTRMDNLGADACRSL